ncbi:MAG: hypothetical protein AVDCRST_MAG41-3791, partial [uncultured Corynebacteriales bacterium]
AVRAGPPPRRAHRRGGARPLPYRSRALWCVGRSLRAAV